MTECERLSWLLCCTDGAATLHQSPARLRSRIAISLGVIITVGAWVFLLFDGPSFPSLGFKELETFVFVLAALTGSLSIWRGAGGVSHPAVGLLALYALSLIAFGLPLSGMWAGGEHASSVMLGLWQTSDASGYEGGGFHLWKLGVLDIFNSRRPLMAAALSGIFAVDSGDLRITQAVWTLINASAAFLAARALARSHGFAAGALAFATLYAFYITQTGSMLSENLGLPLGALSFAILWEGLRGERRWLILAGIFFLSLALNARAGAFFVLPCLILWLTGRELKNGSRHALWSLILASAAASLGFLPGAVLRHFYSGLGEAGFSNFAESLYGLVAGGKSWTQVYADYPEIVGMSALDRPNEIMRLAGQAFHAAPQKLLLGILRAYNDYLFSAKWLRFFDEVALRGAAIVLLALGLFHCWKARRQVWAGFLLAVTSGVLLSAPLLMDGGPRVFAATIPATAALIGLGTVPIAAWLGRSITATKPTTGLAALAFASFLLLLCGPLVPFYAGGYESAGDPNCPDGTLRVITKPRPGSALIVLRDGDPRAGRWPYLSRAQFMSDNALELDPGIAPPFYASLNWDAVRWSLEWTVVPGDQLLSSDKIISVCGAPRGKLIILPSQAPAISRRPETP